MHANWTKRDVILGHGFVLIYWKDNSRAQASKAKLTKTDNITIKKHQQIKQFEQKLTITILPLRCVAIWGKSGCFSIIFVSFIVQFKAIFTRGIHIKIALSTSCHHSYHIGHHNHILVDLGCILEFANLLSNGRHSMIDPAIKAPYLTTTRTRNYHCYQIEADIFSPLIGGVCHEVMYIFCQFGRNNEKLCKNACKNRWLRNIWHALIQAMGTNTWDNKNKQKKHRLTSIE